MKSYAPFSFGANRAQQQQNNSRWGDVLAVRSLAVTPAAPRGFRATPLERKMQLNWDAAADKVTTGWRLYLDTESNLAQIIKDVSTLSAELKLTDVLDHNFFLSAVSAGGRESRKVQIQAAALGIVLDNVSDGAIFSKAAAYGKNMVPNPSADLNTVGSSPLTDVALGAFLLDSWVAQQNDGSAFNLWFDNASSHSGKNCFFIRIRSSQSVPAMTTLGGKIRSLARLPLAVGDSVRVSGYMNVSNTAAVPAGLAVSFVFGIDIFDGNDVFIGSLAFASSNAATGGWVFQQKAIQIPSTLSGSVPAYGKFFQGITVQNTTGAAVSTPAGLMGDYRLDDVRCAIQSTAFDLTPISTAYVFAVNPCTGVSGGVANTAKINVASSSPQTGDGQVSYTGQSPAVSNLLDGTDYYVYADDPTYSGGAVTYQATTDPKVANAGNGRVCFGKVHTPAFGGGNTTGTGGGSGPATMARLATL